MSAYHSIIQGNIAKYQTAHASPFAETVTYTPLGGDAVTFQAEVFRNQPTVFANGEPGVSTQVSIPKSTDATVGRSSINIGGDTVAFKKNIDDAANTTYTVATIIEQDQGAWLLEVQ